MPGHRIRAMCACGFRKDWQVTTLSDQFREETDADFSLEMLNEAMKRRAEMEGPLQCPKCQLNSVYLYFPEHRN